MTSFYYYDQNPSGFCFLVLIRAFVIQTSLGYERKNEKDSGRSSKMTPSCKWPIDKSGPLFLEFNRCEDTIQLFKQIANSVTWPLYLPWSRLTFAFNLLYEDWITLRRWLFAWFWKKKIRISKSLFFNFSSRSKPWCLSKPATFKLR